MITKNTVFLLLIAGLTLHGQDHPNLTLPEALTRAMTRETLKSALRGRMEEARSQVVDSKTWDNPEWSFSSESIDQDLVSGSESYILISQRVQLMGRRARILAAQQMEEVAHLENTSRLQQIKATVETLFYQTLHYQKRVEIASRWQETLVDLTRIMKLREEAGEISGYDLRWITREKSRASSEAVREQAYLDAAWEQLAALVGLQKRHRLDGALLPERKSLEVDVSQNPNIRIYEEMEKAAQLQSKAAKAWKLPEITLQAGMRRTVLGSDRDQGFYFGVAAPLPVFNRNKAASMSAAALARVSQNERAMALSEIDGRARSLNRKFARLHHAALSYEAEILTQSNKLADIALAAFEAGENDLFALLDAYQSQRDAALELAALKAEVRNCAIELAQLGGFK